MKHPRHLIPLTLVFALLIGACGSEGISLTEYVEQVNVVAEVASQKGAELLADAAQTTDATPQQVQAGLERGLREIRIPLQEAIDDISPPDQLADLHDVMWDWHANFITIERALAARVGTTDDTGAGWEALSDSPEMASFRSAVAEGKQLCDGFQAELDDIAALGVFADTPWMPGELQNVVEAALGCQWFPEHPEDLYRYPPPAP